MVAFTDQPVTNNTPSTDATLSALTVSPRDIIGFSAGRTSYEVGVASTVTTATVAATKNDDVATAVITPADADTNTAGHQVTLSAGRNAVTVMVTAEDTTTTRAYRVNVNRGVTTDYGWKASDDLDGLITAGNGDIRGLWSNGTTMWVVDTIDDDIYAYTISDGSRDANKELTNLPRYFISGPRGIWSDDTTMWVADTFDGKLYAFNLSTKTPDSTKDIDLHSDNTHPRGIWSDGITMWVTDRVDRKLYAYKMSDKSRDSGKDFNTLIAAGNDDITGIWADETTMWVADTSDDKIYAYKMSDKSRDSGKDFNTLNGVGNNGPRGIWSDGTTMWVTDLDDDKVYSYNHPVLVVSAEVNGTSFVITFNQDLGAAASLANGAFAVKKTPDGESEGTVTLSGTPGISGKAVTLTLDTAVVFTDGGIKVSYTKPSTGSDNKLVDTDGNETPSFTDLAVTNNSPSPPGQPTGLTATATGPARIDLSWTAPASTGGSAITGYKVEVSTDGGTTWTDQVANTASTDTTYAHTGLTAGSTRHYRVSAINSVGTGAASATAMDTTNVFVRNTGQGSDSSDDANLDLSQRFTTGSNSDGYSLTSIEVVSEDSDGDGFTAAVWTVDSSGHPETKHADLTGPDSFAAETLTFTAPANTTLAANTTYTLVFTPVGSNVVDFNRTGSDDEDAGAAAGWSIQGLQEWYNPNTMVWSDDGSGLSFRIAVRGVALTPPAPLMSPPSVRSDATNDQVTLTLWRSIKYFAMTGYSIWRAEYDGDFEHYADIPSERTWNDDWDSETYTDTDVLPGVYYSYRIYAVNGLEKSQYAATTRVETVGSVPDGLRFSVTHTSVTLNWDDPEDDTITGYRILRSVNWGTETTLASNVNAAATSYVDRRVSPGTAYAYRVQAVRGGQVYSASRYVTVLTAPRPRASTSVLERAGRDLPASASTTGLLKIGDTVSGTISSLADKDWFAVDLTAGKDYFIRLRHADEDSWDTSWSEGPLIITCIRDATGNETPWEVTPSNYYSPCITDISGVYRAIDTERH